MPKNLHNTRREYKKRSLTENETPASPFLLFKVWLDDAIKYNANEPIAMNLATSSIVLSIGKGGKTGCMTLFIPKR